MAIFNKTFSFASTSEGWQFPPDVRSNPQQGDTEEGAPVMYSLGYNGSGFLQSVYTPRNGDPSSVSGYMWWRGSWMDLGIPSGSTVTQVVSSVSRKVGSLGPSGSTTSGPVQVYKQSGTMRATLVPARTVNVVDSSWNISPSGTPYSVDSDLQPANSPIELRIQDLSSMTPPGANRSYYDDLVLSMTYSNGPSAPTYTSDNLTLSQKHSLSGNGVSNVPVFSGQGSLSRKSVFTGNGNYTDPQITGGGSIIVQGLRGNKLISQGYSSGTPYTIAPPGSIIVQGLRGNRFITQGFSSAAVQINNSANMFLKCENTNTSMNAIPMRVSTGTLTNNPQGLNLSVGGIDPGVGYEYTGYGINFRPTMSPPLFVSGTNAAPFSNSATLFVQGFVNTSSKTLNLYLEQKLASNNVTLTIAGSSSSAMAIMNASTLFVNAYGRTSNYVSLVTKTANFRENFTTLFLQGSPNQSESLNLSITGKMGTPLNATATLFIYGNTNSMQFAAVPLFMPKSPPIYEPMNLFVSGYHDNYQFNNSVNLFVAGQNLQSMNSTSLYLKNEQESVYGSSSLYVRGLGKYPGHVPSGDSLNLYVGGSGSGNVTFPVQQNSVLALYAAGDITLPTGNYNVTPLFVKVDEGYEKDSTVTLYIAGAVPSPMNNNVTLILPRVNFVRNLPLYTHGF